MKKITFILCTCILVFSAYIVSGLTLQNLKSSDNYREFSNNALTVLLKQNPSLQEFYRKLFDNTANGEKEIIKYLLNDYPVIVPGNKGKMSHHHRFIVRDKKNEGILKKKIYKDINEKNEEGLKEFNSYKLNFSDFRYFETENYDNLRYAWWNPYVENFNDPRYFSGMQLDYFERTSIKDSGKVLIINYFKTTLDRSSDNILELYNRFKKPFFEIVGRDLYLALKLNITVDTLLEGYAYYKKNNSEGFIKMLQTRYYPDTNPRSLLILLSKSNFYWYYNFWERRNLEKNSEVIIDILKEIQDHYKKI
jgi:hypothetical protein